MQLFEVFHGHFSPLWGCLRNETRHVPLWPRHSAWMGRSGRSDRIPGPEPVRIRSEIENQPVRATLQACASLGVFALNVRHARAQGLHVRWCNEHMPLPSWPLIHPYKFQGPLSCRMRSMRSCMALGQRHTLLTLVLLLAVIVSKFSHM